MIHILSNMYDRTFGKIVLQIKLIKFEIIAKLRFKNQANLSKLINFYYPRNHHKICFAFMIWGGIENQSFAEICLTLEVKFGQIPLVDTFFFLNNIFDFHVHTINV